MRREERKKFKVIRAGAIACAAALGMLIATGCGQIVSERLAVSASTRTGPCLQSIVVMPFADYTYTDDLAEAYKRNNLIMEELTDQLVAAGYNIPPQEDVLQFLVAQNIIQDTGAAIRLSGLSAASELNNDWSPAMKEEITKLLASEQRILSQGGKRRIANALDKESLARIAEKFNAGLIMRGRVLKYGTEQENTWNPLRRGLLPVIYGGANRAFLGVFNTETYDTVGSMAMGYGMGALAGNQTSNPYSYADKANPAAANTIVWGLAGAGLGYLAEKGGKANEATVQLRLWVQDPDSARIIWTNRIEVKVKPQTVFAQTNRNRLFETAVHKAVNVLVRDFVARTQS